MKFSKKTSTEEKLLKDSSHISSYLVVIAINIQVRDRFVIIIDRSVGTDRYARQFFNHITDHHILGACKSRHLVAQLINALKMAKTAVRSVICIRPL